MLKAILVDETSKVSLTTHNEAKVAVTSLNPQRYKGDNTHHEAEVQHLEGDAKKKVDAHFSPFILDQSYILNRQNNF